MIGTPDFEKKEQTILDTFLEMNWEEQYTIIGSLRVFADRAYANRKAHGEVANTSHTSAKVIQFPAAASM